MSLAGSRFNEGKMRLVDKLAQVPESDRRRIVWDNAVALYGLTV